MLILRLEVKKIIRQSLDIDPLSDKLNSHTNALSEKSQISSWGCACNWKSAEKNPDQSI